MKTVSEHAIDIINGGEAALVLLIADTADLNFGGPMATGLEHKICGISKVTLEFMLGSGGDMEVVFEYMPDKGRSGAVEYGTCYFQINDDVLVGEYTVDIE